MMRRIFYYLIVALILGAPAAYADVAQDKANISQILKQQFPEVKIDEIAPSPVTGIYQVSAGAMVLYFTADGHYAFSGDLIDLQDRQKNLTEQTRKNARIKGLKALEESMIVFPAKTPKYTVTVFTDIDCGYCRQLQSEMPKLNDMGITVRYLAFPRGGPKAASFDKMMEVWCAKDKKQAIVAANQGKSFTAQKCSTESVRKSFEFGMALGITGTPTLIFEDGSMVPGYLPPDKMLEAVKYLSKSA